MISLLPTPISESIRMRYTTVLNGMTDPEVQAARWDIRRGTDEFIALN